MHHTISLRNETIKLNIRNGVVSGAKPSGLQREVSRITQRLLLLKINTVQLNSAVQMIEYN